MLEKAPDIARAIARGPQNVFWRRLAKELNDIGPATKDPSSWKKVPIRRTPKIGVVQMKKIKLLFLILYQNLLQ